MTWEAGRRLSTMSNGSTNISFTYNDEGIRTSKTVDGVATSYTSIDGRIKSQNDGTNQMYFRYDKNNSLTGFNLNGTEYIYIKNTQGDITGILDKEGKKIVSYTYDAWGKVESISGSSADTVGKRNPMRYRGYYEDTETGLFYIVSRYYDPSKGSFISTDEPNSINPSNSLSANLYTYCDNNPVMYYDPDGHRKGDLEDIYKIDNSYTAPISVTVTGNNITIVAYVRIEGSLADKIFPGTNQRYRTVIKRGIENKWRGRNYLINGYGCRLTTRIVDLNNGSSYWLRRGQKSVLIDTKDTLGVSHVTWAPKWRKGSPGVMTLYRGDSRNNSKGLSDDLSTFRSVVAHEFGHLLGVDDLYNKSYMIRNKYAPNSRPSIFWQMYKAKRPSNIDVEKVLKAFLFNKVQDWR